jgi:hypothetical protein
MPKLSRPGATPGLYECVILCLFNVQRRQQPHRLYSDGTKMCLQKPLIEKMGKNEADCMSYLTWDTKSALERACVKTSSEQVRVARG